jgi:phage/plasmid-associated DNA primase
VHVTQRSVSASLIYHGHPVEEVVETVLAATQEAMGTAGARWNWQREQRKIRRMCVTAVAKVETWSRQRARPSPRPAAPVETPPEDDGGTEGPPDGSKESLEESVSRETKESLESTPEAPKPALKLVASNDGKGAGKGKEQGDAKVKQKPRQVSSVHLVLADATLKVMRQRGQDLMFTREGDYRYGSGLWHLEGDRDMKRWLDMLLEEGAHGLKMESSNRLIREAREYLMRLPELHRDDIRFDAHGKIPTLSGLVDPRTGEVTPAKPEHYCRWQIPYAYDPDATCPLWLQMQEDVFADRSVEVRAAHVGLLQELLGAGLIDLKPKGLMRALVLVGGSDFGKSGLLDVMAGLYGRQHNATSMDALNGPHGLMPFISRVPWLLHEAFDAGRWHLSGVVKALISGDAIQINIKGSKIFTHHFTAPAFWGANSAPNFKEATDAIVNRLVVVECKRKFYPDEPVGVAAFARERGFEKPQHLVLATEMSGVLTWAVEGLRRALARGYFELPEESKAAAENVRIDSNLVAGFIRDCVEFDPSNMVSTPDFSAAFASWWLENKGEDSGIPRAERIGWAIKALGDPRIAVDRNEIRLTSRRYYAGISLNADGRRHWSNTTSSDAFVFQGRTTNTSTEIADVNKMIPVDWDAKPMIQAMRAAYDKMAK